MSQPPAANIEILHEPSALPSPEATRDRQDQDHPGIAVHHHAPGTARLFTDEGSATSTTFRYCLHCHNYQVTCPLQGPPGTGKTKTILALLSIIMHSAPPGSARLMKGSKAGRPMVTLDLNDQKRLWLQAAPWLLGHNPRSVSSLISTYCLI